MSVLTADVDLLKTVGDSRKDEEDFCFGWFFFSEM